MSVEIYQLIFCVLLWFICVFDLETSSFFGKSPLFIPILVLSLRWHFSFPRDFLLICSIFRVSNWAEKLGGELWHLGEFITSREEIQKVKAYIHTFFICFDGVDIAAQCTATF